MSRLYLRLLPVCLLVVLWAAVPVRAEEALNLLFFGNSFSQGGLHWRVADLAAADGHARPLVLLDSLGGMDLTYHIGEVNNSPQNNVNHPSIAGKTWDYVVLQEHSTKSTTAMGKPAVFQADALELYRKVRDHSSGRGVGVRCVLLQTWARAPGNYLVNPHDYRSAWDSSVKMQADLTSNYALANAGIDAAEAPGTSAVAPVGEAFLSLNFAASLYGADLYHPSAEGTLLGSMVVYRLIYKEKVSDISYASAKSWAGVDEAAWNRVTAAADSMVIPVIQQRHQADLLHGK